MIGKLWMVLAFFGTAIIIAIMPAFAQVTACDRACLEGVADNYLEALIAHDPSRVPLADNVKYVENGIALKPGQGLWKTATGLGTYRHYFADIRAGQVGLIASMQQNGKGQVLVLRLKVVAGKITEVEQMIINDGFSASSFDKYKLDPLWRQETPPAGRVARDALIAASNKYWAGMQENDGKGDYSFFHKDCDRFEHTRQTTNMPPSKYGHSDITEFVTMGCEDQFKSRLFGFVTRIRGRRFPVVDEERQAVLAFSFFDHNGTIRDIPLSTGQNFHVPPYFSTPRTLMLAEGFKIVDGKIRLIEALLTETPYGMQSAFDVPMKVAPVVGQCDRACLNGMVDRVLEAMIAHDPSRVPLANNVRYTENGQELALNDGLWGTLTERGSYSVYLADETGGQAGFLGSTVETNVPGMLTLRLKLKEGFVTEIEAISVRQEKPLNGELMGTQTLMGLPWMTDLDSNAFVQPNPALVRLLDEEEKISKSDMARAVNRYLDALQNGTAASAPIANDCSIRVNGTQASENPAAPAVDPAKPDFRPYALGCAAQIDSGLFSAVSQFRKRRVSLIDPEKGLVLVVAEIDHPADKIQIRLPGIGTIDAPPAFQLPNTYLSTMIYKIRQGRISLIEQVERPVLYGISSGWTD
jgi:hypothetical protein